LIVKEFFILNTALNQQNDRTYLVHAGCQNHPQLESPHYYIPERNTLKQEMLFSTGTIHKRSLVASAVTAQMWRSEWLESQLYVSLSVRF